MKQEDFEEWMENPVTGEFLKYLEDKISLESKLVAEIITSGGVLEHDEQVRIAESCATLTSIREIEYSEIQEFYLEEE